MRSKSFLGTHALLFLQTFVVLSGQSCGYCWIIVLRDCPSCAHALLLWYKELAILPLFLTHKLLVKSVRVD